MQFWHWHEYSAKADENFFKFKSVLYLESPEKKTINDYMLKQLK